MFAHEILNHAMEEKENVACEELKSVSLGCMVDDVFRERVTYVRKGKRNERKCCYKNLTRRYPSDTHESPIPSIENLSCIIIYKEMFLGCDWLIRVQLIPNITQNSAKICNTVQKSVTTVQKSVISSLSDGIYSLKNQKYGGRIFTFA